MGGPGDDRGAPRRHPDVIGESPTACGSRNRARRPTRRPITCTAVATIEPSPGREAGADGGAVTPEVLEALQTPVTRATRAASTASRSPAPPS